MLDRQDITDCLLRYTRGVDRCDAELIESAYSPDAVDFHGVVDGSVSDFLAYFLPQQSQRVVCQHYLTNIAIDLDGDEAHCESYYLVLRRLEDSYETLLSGGRYADRLVRSEDGWRIVVRVVLSEWLVTADGSGSAALSQRSTRDRTDLVYRRPLLGVD
jgi:hypothetical protein